MASLVQIYRTHSIGKLDAAEHARAIGRSLRLAITNPRRFPDRYLVVRYEDLVDDPNRQIELVRRFLGIAADATLSIPTAAGTAVLANSSYERGVAGAIERQPSPALPAELSDLLGVYTASDSRAFGYDLAPPSPLRRGVIRFRHWPRHALRSSRVRLRDLVGGLAPRRR
jgi:hypothetical protein